MRALLSNRKFQFAANGGFELPAFLGYSAAAVGLAGPGRYSLDHLTGHRLDRPWVMVITFAASAAAATCVIRRRNAYLRAKAPASQQRM